MTFMELCAVPLACVGSSDLYELCAVQVWVPVTFMNFALSPMWMRIPVVATTSLGWTCILR